MIALRYSVPLAAAMWLAAGAVSDSAVAQPAPTPAAPKIGQQGKDAIWVPTPQALVEKMLDLAKVSANDTLVDLGSGDGRMVIAAAKRGASARGIEYDENLVAISRLNAAREGVSEKASFERADIFATDFSRADVVALFLLPQLNEKLRPTILDMKPGTRVVSNTFELGAWQPDEIASLDGECDYFFCKALLWIVPAKVAGKWRMDRGELALKQQFQNVTGTLADPEGGAAVPVTGRLRGSLLTVTAGGIAYTGTVNGVIIDGTTAAGEPWQAKRSD